MWLLGAGGWAVAAVLVALGAGRLIAAADRATRPETASDASERVGDLSIPETGRPDGSGPIRRQNGASPDEPTPLAGLLRKVGAIGPDDNPRFHLGQSGDTK
jgi:hypothetical protein